MAFGGDVARRKRAVRKGREAGCWVYIPAELLREAGRAGRGTPPEYRVWAGPRGSVMVTLYADRAEAV